MEPKYELVPEGRLFRLKALRYFGNVLRGDLGGLVAGEHNLSHEGNCWVFGDAIVSGNAMVWGNAGVSGDAQVYGDAQIYGNAWVSGDAWVLDSARIYGDAQIYGNARVSGDAWVSGNAQISGNTHISGNSRVYDSAHISGDCRVYDSASVYGNVRVTCCLFLQQPKHDITITDDHIFIGCEGHTWQYWNKHIVAIGKKHNYSDEEIKHTKALLIILCNQINDMKRAANGTQI